METRAENPSTRKSSGAAPSGGREIGQKRTIRSRPQRATRMPSEPPASPRSRFSTRICRASRPPLAPSARRTANSRMRPVARDNSTPARFTDAIRRTSRPRRNRRRTRVQRRCRASRAAIARGKVVRLRRRGDARRRHRQVRLRARNRDARLEPAHGVDVMRAAIGPGQLAFDGNDRLCPLQRGHRGRRDAHQGEGHAVEEHGGAGRNAAEHAPPEALGGDQRRRRVGNVLFVGEEAPATGCSPSTWKNPRLTASVSTTCGSPRPWRLGASSR